jgi:hypothetical protein
MQSKMLICYVICVVIYTCIKGHLADWLRAMICDDTRDYNTKIVWLSL